MSAAILSPKNFSPTDLDDYLAKGWRPYGQQIYTADFIQLQLGEVYSVIPTRLDLSKHQWRKGQRKLLRKGKNNFTYSIRTAHLTLEKKEINDQYRNLFPDKSVEDLSIHLEHKGEQIFDTHEINIYDGDKLVAFSFFDLGEKCVYSKLGIYNPAYHKYSLGLFSMYLEIEWCMAEGLAYYYPGYISPETSLFDYKKQSGQLDFWSMRERAWLPLSSFISERHTPLKMIEIKTKFLFDSLSRKGLKGRIYDYCFFEMPLIYPGSRDFLDTPLFILLHYPHEKTCWIVRYKIEYDTFECWQANCSYKVAFRQIANRKTPIFEFVLQLQQPIIQTDDSEVFIIGVEKLIGKTQQQLNYPYPDEQST